MKYFFKSVSISLVIFFSLGASVGLTKTPVLSKICSKFTYLDNQDYALCAGAKSWNFDGVTYAKCKKQNGTSISLPLNYPTTSPASNPATLAGNVEDVNKEGIANNTYVVSTYNPPAEATKRGGSLALYTCNRKGSYAQCDGGICFNGTTGTSFPGVGAIASDEILCSCPITTTSTSYQVYGPSACPTTKADYDAICGSGNEANKNGKILMIGAPTTSPKLLAQCLNLHNNVSTTVTFNTCKRPS
jgi:hypothetical protein